MCVLQPENRLRAEQPVHDQLSNRPNRRTADGETAASHGCGQLILSIDDTLLGNGACTAMVRAQQTGLIMVVSSFVKLLM